MSTDDGKKVAAEWVARVQQLQDERDELLDALARLYQRCLNELADPEDVHEMHMANRAIARVKP